MLLKRLNGYFVMTKPRAMVVVLVTSAAGYLLAERGALDFVLLFNLLLGAGLSGGGSIVLNQVMERRHDGRMERTKNRPLPSGLISPRAALIWGTFLSIAGTAWLAMTVNGLTAVLGGLCVLSYVLCYTPLKRVTTLNTVVGAVPGAIPPMMGWAAETGGLEVEAWVLFAILFVWQFPHFLAIGWLYREDYSRAGYTMLSRFDEDGGITARQILLNSACLMAVSLMPASFGFAGLAYTLGAVVLGLGLLVAGVVFLRSRTRPMAALVLKSTIVHISLLMLLLVMDRT